MYFVFRIFNLFLSFNSVVSNPSDDNYSKVKIKLNIKNHKELVLDQVDPRHCVKGYNQVVEFLKGGSHCVKF